MNTTKPKEHNDYSGSINPRSEQDKLKDQIKEMREKAALWGLPAYREHSIKLLDLEIELLDLEIELLILKDQVLDLMDTTGRDDTVKVIPTMTPNMRD